MAVIAHAQSSIRAAPLRLLSGASLPGRTKAAMGQGTDSIAAGRLDDPGRRLSMIVDRFLLKRGAMLKLRSHERRAG